MSRTRNAAFKPGVKVVVIDASARSDGKKAPFAKGEAFMIKAVSAAGHIELISDRVTGWWNAERFALASPAQ